MRRAFLEAWVVVVAGGACAPLNTQRMSERCRGLYSACLNACERQEATSTPPQARPGYPPPVNAWDYRQQSVDCTYRCNEEYKDCH